MKGSDKYQVSSPGRKTTQTRLNAKAMMSPLKYLFRRRKKTQTKKTMKTSMKIQLRLKKANNRKDRRDKALWMKNKVENF